MNEKILEGLKAQQRLAIKAAVVKTSLFTENAADAKYQTKENAFTKEKADELENYAKKTYSENITDGLEGQAATAAKDYLSKVSKPELTSPLRN